MTCMIGCSECILKICLVNLQSYLNVFNLIFPFCPCAMGLKTVINLVPFRPFSMQLKPIEVAAVFPI